MLAYRAGLSPVSTAQHGAGLWAPWEAGVRQCEPVSTMTGALN